jgi:hypothetical protein|tara:strand:+ start:1076 stop:2239 length:1164 start_codon:yes stop_codon:yes gene_type:complete
MIEIDDIFDISSVTREETNDYNIEDVKVISQITFEERVGELRKKISNSDFDIPVLNNKAHVIEEIVSTNEEADLTMSKTARKSSEDLLTMSIEKDNGPNDFLNGLNELNSSNEKNGSNGMNDSDDIFKEYTGEDLSEPDKVKTAEAVEAEVVETTEESSVELKDHVQIVDDQIQWLLDSPTDKYKHFYAQKAEFIPQVLIDGQIPYKRWLKDLKTSSIDITVLEIYDLTEIYEKMRELQQVRDRVQEIAIQCNAQYFLWERTVEMFRGLLMQVEYDKPKDKQAGLEYIHMRDMEVYFRRLKGVHETVGYVLDTLKLAFGTLSRQVTIALDNREPLKRKAKPESVEATKLFNKENVDNMKNSGYDKLENDASAKVQKSTGEVDDWGSF